MSIVRVADVERALDVSFPTEWAEEWDRVGLLAGDPAREVSGVMLALDPTRDAIRRTVVSGANVLVTHHPAFLKAPDWLTPGRGAAGVVFEALESGVALINAHTNLDRAPAAGHLLPDLLGLLPRKPIERSTMPMCVVTVFAPLAHADRIIEAMAGAGAGHIGEYRRCSFTSAGGTGAYSASSVAKPFSGAAGASSSTEEVRIEMVAARRRGRGVVAAARSAHPYEEPLITVAEVEMGRSSARMGMLSDAPGALTLAHLAADAARVFGVTPRVWGDPEVTVSRIATATGSASSLVGDVLASGAHALVTGEVRYHDALDAVENGLTIVELGHDVSEWPLVSLLASAVGTVEGLDADAVHVLPSTPAWWTP